MAIELEEFMTRVGFAVNQTELSSVLDALGRMRNQTELATAGIGSSLIKSGSALVGFIVTATVATGKFVESVANADLEVEKLARRMYMSEEAARGMDLAARAMGESVQNLNDIAMNPELTAQFKELYGLSRELGAPGELQDQLKFIRSISFEFKKFSVIVNYAGQHVAYYLGKLLGPQLAAMKQKLQEFNDYIIRNMPAISEKIANVLYVIVRLFEMIGRIIYSVAKASHQFWTALPKEAQIAMGALAAIFFASLNPVNLLIMGISFLLLLFEDYVSWTQGKKTAFGKIWEGGGAIFGELTTSIGDLQTKIEGILNIDGFNAPIFSALPQFSVMKGFLKDIWRYLDLIKDLISLDFKSLGENFIPDMASFFGIGQLLQDPFQYGASKFGFGLGNAFKGQGAAGVNANLSQNISIFTNDMNSAANSTGKFGEQLINRALKSRIK